jgi:uncharacterized protein (DUF1501 family)
MKRRDFLAATSSFLLPLTLNGLGIKAYNENSSLVKSLKNTAALNSDRILVMINMIGGNDGLNTVIPLDQYSQYQALRSNIAIPESSVLPLPGNIGTGLHPAMTGLRDMYGDGKLAIVHSVGYPNPNQSHYRSAEIWMSAVDYNQYDDSGWAGRYLNDRYPGYPSNYPNATMEDPIALQIGYLATPTLQGPTQSMAVTIDSPDNFYQLIGAAEASSPSNIPPLQTGEQIAYIRKQQALAVGYATEIKAAADAGVNLATYPNALADNDLADQLKIVARLISGGLKTKIFFVTQYGYDTHSTQVDASDNKIGAHASLLGKLSTAISTFQLDMELQGNADKVVGMTFSEFGRRANSNASKGTDHGVAAPVFVFGNGLKKSTIGQNPNLTTELLPPNPQPWETSRDIKMQVDFRRLYNDILTDWFGTVPITTNNLLFRNFDTLTLFTEPVESLATGNWENRDLWSVARKPMAHEIVKIKAGHTLTINENTTVKSVIMEGDLVVADNKTLTLKGGI